MFVDNNNYKYIGYYNQAEKEVEILGPVGNEGKATLRQSYVASAESEAKAVEIIIRTLKSFKQDDTGC